VVVVDIENHIVTFKTSHATIFAVLLNNIKPIANAGNDFEVSVDPVCTVDVTLDGSGSYDADNDILTYTWSWGDDTINGITPTIELPLGIHTITLIVNNGIADSEPDTVSITVVDTTPPKIALTVSPHTLWPHNHKMVPITVDLSVTDNCDSEPVCQITSVSSNEPDNGSGDGNTPPDWVIAGDLTVDLRAERSGSGNGRIYTIEVTFTDASGNSSTNTVNVTVPHDKGKGKGKKK
jgi:PKD domain